MMIAAAKDSNVILMVGQNSRRMERYRKAKELIDKGMVGKIVLAEANSSGNLGLRLTPEIWRYYRKESPGGPLTTYTVHQTDNLHYLVGPIKRVTAFTAKLGGPAETEDVAAATVQFECGALGTIGGTFITPDRNYMQVHGTEGVILIDEDGGSVSYQKKGTENMVKYPTEDVDKQRLDSLKEEMNEFATSILENKEPETNGEVGLQAVAVIEAIHQSAESGKIVNIEDLFQRRFHK
jgi:predicted dehydrogenase